MKLITKILIPAVLVGLIAGGAAFYFASKKNKEPEINQSALYIGIPKSQDGQDVVLHLTVDSSSGKANKEYYSSDLKPLEGQDENLVFLNYASDPLIPLDGKEIGYWLNDSSNSIKVQTECLELIYSNYVSIDKAGIWFINVASENGKNPDYSHSYVYKSGGINL